MIAVVGALVFSRGTSATTLAIGRGLIGLGVSACLMASFHVFALWAPGERLPFLNGAVMAMGALGALTGTAPIETATAAIGWRQVFVYLAAATLFTSILMAMVVPEKPQQASRDENLRDVARGLKDVYRSRIFWSVAPLSIVHQGTYLGIQSLWAGPWLRDIAGLDRTGVGSHLFTLALGMAIGFAGLGFITGRLARYGVTPLHVWACAASLFQLSQLAITFVWTTHFRATWFLFGIFGASGMLSYVIVTRRFPLAMAGRVNAGLNVLVFTGAFAIQAGVGAVIQHFSPAGAPFSSEGYRVAFGAVLACQVLALVWLFATRTWRRKA